MPLVLKLAARNLLYDKLRFAATVIGIVFSIVLVTVQLGLFVSFERTVTIMIDHAPADLWIVPLGTKCFEDPSLLDEANRYQGAVDRGRVAGRPDPDQLCAMAHAERRRLAGFGHRFGFARRWIAPLGSVEGSLDALLVPNWSRSTVPMRIGWASRASGTRPNA